MSQEEQQSQQDNNCAASGTKASAAATTTTAPVNTTDVIRLRGLPFTVTEEQVREFFNGHSIEEIVILTQGYHRGEGYVRMSDDEVATQAIAALHRKNIGDRYVELYPSNAVAMDNARQAANTYATDPGNLLRLRGLPFTATDQDVRDFFGPELGAAVTEITMGVTGDFMSTGEAFVRFDSAETKDEALKKHRDVLGTRYIEIFDSSIGERDMVLSIASRSTRGGAASNGRAGGGPQLAAAAAVRGGIGMLGAGRGGAGRGSGLAAHPQHHHHHHQHHQHHHVSAAGYDPYVAAAQMQAVAAYGYQHHQQVNNPQQADGGAAAGSNGSQSSTLVAPGHRQFPVIRIRGLPFSANETQVAEFLRGVNVPPQGVHMVYNASERPTGDAFVEVCSPEDVQAALRLHKHTMGHRYVEIFESSQADMYRLQTGMPVGMTIPPMVMAQQAQQVQRSYMAHHQQHPGELNPYVQPFHSNHYGAPVPVYAVYRQ